MELSLEVIFLIGHILGMADSLRVEGRAPWSHTVALYSGALWGPQSQENLMSFASAFYSPFIRFSWIPYAGAFPVAQMVNNLPANVGEAKDKSSIPGSRRCPGEGNGNLLQYSCLENSMDRGAWRATVYRVAKSQTQLSMHATHGDRMRCELSSQVREDTFISFGASGQG